MAEYFVFEAAPFAAPLAIPRTCRSSANYQQRSVLCIEQGTKEIQRIMIAKGCSPRTRCEITDDRPKEVSGQRETPLAPNYAGAIPTGC